MSQGHEVRFPLFFPLFDPSFPLFGGGRFRHAMSARTADRALYQWFVSVLAVIAPNP